MFEDQVVDFRHGYYEGQELQRWDGSVARVTVAEEEPGGTGEVCLSDVKIN